MQTNHEYQIELLVLDSNNWNHLTVETIAILVCKQISSDLKMKLPTNCVQTNVMLNCDCYIAILETI